MSQLTDTFTSMANAIRSKTGSSSAFTPAQMITEIENMSTWGGAIEPYKYASTAITSYTGNEDLILDGAFIGCYNLNNVSFPKCSYIGYWAFNRCSSLQSNISFPECSYIGIGAFTGCSNLNNISFPKCTYLGNTAFGRCTSLSNVSFPKCSYIGSYAFQGCSKLTNISFPNAGYIGSSAFDFCSSLTTVSFPKCSYIGSYAFNNCKNLSSLYLLSTSVVSLANINAFNFTPLSSTGKIYVPSSLVATYKTATNWKNLSARITAY